MAHGDALPGQRGCQLPEEPVKVNLLLRDFAIPRPTRPRWTRGKARRKRALYVSSPIGLGHAQRDIAIAAELRKLHPDLQIDWLAQHPVITVLEERGERVHPASAHLASKSGHIESESAEHDLHAFQAIRRMDEILLANFMVFHDLVREEDYDLWIGDEAWELDYYLHENPEQKNAAYAWFTDFVGWLPMPDGGPREALLTTGYNAEMIEHIARHPRIRDRAIFVGDPDDIVADAFGPGLPLIRDWTRQHYDFAGYITGFDPRQLGDVPVLAEPAAQVAPGRTERQHRRPRQEMVQRLLLDRVHAVAAGAPVGRQHDRVLLAHPHEAEPPLSLVQAAGPRAHITLDPPVTGAMPVPRGPPSNRPCPPRFDATPAGTDVRRHLCRLPPSTPLTGPEIRLPARAASEPDDLAGQNSSDL